MRRKPSHTPPAEERLIGAFGARTSLARQVVGAIARRMNRTDAAAAKAYETWSYECGTACGRDVDRCGAATEKLAARYGVDEGKWKVMIHES